MTGMATLPKVKKTPGELGVSKSIMVKVRGPEGLSPPAPI